MQGMSISTPSNPNLFSAVHFLARKASNPMDLDMRASSRRFCTLSSVSAPGASSLSRILAIC